MTSGIYHALLTAEPCVFPKLLAKLLERGEKIPRDRSQKASDRRTDDEAAEILVDAPSDC